MYALSAAMSMTLKSAIRTTALNREPHGKMFLYLYVLAPGRHDEVVLFAGKVGADYRRQSGSFGSHGDSLLGADKERESEFLFKRRDKLAHGRRCVAESFRGSPEASAFA